MTLPHDSLVGLRRVAGDYAGLRLLVLHGSRSRERQHEGSDWDFGYLADSSLDPAALHADISRLLRADAIDLVDLARTSALLRFEAARHGQCVYANPPDAFMEFVLEATIFWCDAESVIRRAQAAVLSELST
jgi:hypothetical protein